MDETPKLIKAIAAGDKTFCINDIVKIEINISGVIERKYTGRITSMNNTDLCLDTSEKFFGKTTCIGYSNIESIELIGKMEEKEN